MSNNPYEPPLLREEAKPPVKEAWAWYVRYPLGILAAMGAFAMLVELDFGIRQLRQRQPQTWSDVNVVAYLQLVILPLSLIAVSVSLFVGDRLKRLGQIGIIVFLAALFLPPLRLLFRF